MFTDQIIQQVWEKATVVEGFDSKNIRKDACGAWILRSKYGLRDSEFGWEIDHVYPISLGGDDNFLNLRAMQWENNVSKGDDYPSYISVVKAEGNKNIAIEGQYAVNVTLKRKLKDLYENK